MMEWYEYFPVKEGNVVVDLGAALGKATIFFSRKVGNNGLVIAVEPVIKNYRRIIQLIINQQLYNIIPLMVAVTDKTGHSIINLSRDYDGHSLYWKNVFAGKRVTTTITWDDLVDICNISHVDLMKMNIEGGEINVLSGMTKVFPNKIVMTEHLRHEEKPERVWLKLINLLDSKGYKIIKRESCFLYAERND